jgi:Electron transfer DM13
MRRAVLTIASAIVVLGCSSQSGGAATVAPGATQPAVGAPSAAASPGSMQVMGSGQLRPVDGTASGTAQLVVQPDGSYEVVLEDFSTTSTEHTNVVLTKNSTVDATADVDKSMLLDLGPLVSTSGMQSYRIPADMAGGVTEGYHSVVIWDTAMAHAIAAATLK